MYNDFSGFDAHNNPVKISVPPTLLISSIGVHDDVAKAVSMDAKIDGDLVYVIGETAEELGGSEYFAHLGFTGKYRPGTGCGSHEGALREADRGDPARARGIGVPGHPRRTRDCPCEGRDCRPARHGYHDPAGMRPDYFLFSESLGRFVVTVAPDNKRAFEQALGTDARCSGGCGEHPCGSRRRRRCSICRSANSRLPTRRRSGGTDHGSGIQPGNTPLPMRLLQPAIRFPRKPSS